MLNLNSCKIYDISVPLKTGMTVYPGNPEFEIESLKSSSGFSTISKITMGTHTGTHIDAPSHCLNDKKNINDYDLSLFFGNAKVFDLQGEDFCITLNSLKKLDIKKNDRVIFKTKNSRKILEPFFSDYIFLSSDGALYLAEKEVLLVAIDYYSVKQKGSSDNTPHTFLLSKNIPILEGINLSGINAGSYTLCAFPLKIQDSDGSFCRAVLIK